MKTVVLPPLLTLLMIVGVAQVAHAEAARTPVTVVAEQNAAAAEEFERIYKLFKENVRYTPLSALKDLADKKDPRALYLYGQLHRIYNNLSIEYDLDKSNQYFRMAEENVSNSASALGLVRLQLDLGADLATLAKSAPLALSDKSADAKQIIVALRETALKAWNTDNAYALFKVLADAGDLNSKYAVGVYNNSKSGGKTDSGFDIDKLEPGFLSALSVHFFNTGAYENAAQVLGKVSNKKPIIEVMLNKAMGAYRTGNNAEAVRLFSIASEFGDVYSKYILAYIYDAGSRVKNDPEKSRQLLDQARKIMATQNNEASNLIYELAALHKDELQDLDGLLFFSREGIRFGDIKTINFAGEFLRIKSNLDDALFFAKEGARLGDKESINMASEILMEKTKAAKSAEDRKYYYSERRKYLAMAADLGDNRATRRLVLTYTASGLCDEAEAVQIKYARNGASDDGAIKACFAERKYAEVLKSTNPQAMYIAASNYENSGERDRAKNVYQSIMTRFPDHPMGLKASDSLTAMKRAEQMEAAAGTVRRRAEEAEKRAAEAEARAEEEASRANAAQRELSRPKTCYSTGGGFAQCY